jgi:hypothetical protein
MEPYIPPVNPGASASGESESAEDAKRQERHHDKMQAFKQAIERSRVVNEQTAAMAQGPLAPPPKSSTTPGGRKTVGQGLLRDVELPEGAELPEEFAAMKQDVPLPQTPQTQAALDPSYRQALLRMQAEGIPLPPSLLDLLEQSEGVKPQKGLEKIPGGEASTEEAEVGAHELADPARDARIAQAKGAAYGDADSHSGSASADKSKKSSTDAAGDAPAQVAALTQSFAPSVQAPGQVQRIPPPAPLVQEMVEFATFGRNEAGFLEFRLGLVQDALGGLRIQLASYGNRRVGIKVKGTGGKAADIGDAELAGLVDALRAKNVEVVEVVRE